MARPSVVAVTSQVPWPLDSGGHLRTFHVLRQLATRLVQRIHGEQRILGPHGGVDPFEERVVRIEIVGDRIIADSGRAAFVVLDQQ